MVGTRRDPRLQSWIPPEFALAHLPGVFGIVVPTGDADIVEFIVKGELAIQVYASKKMMMLFKNHRSLNGQLQDAIWNKKSLKPDGIRLRIGTIVTAFCHGVYLSPDKKELYVLVGRSKHASTPWYSGRLKFEADLLFLEHHAKLSEFSEDIHQQKESNKKTNELIKERFPTEKNIGVLSDSLLTVKEIYQKPVITAIPLFDWIPHAAKFSAPVSWDARKIHALAIAAISSSGGQPSRDGSYTILLPGIKSGRSHGIVSWVPHTGLPSYPEIRWAVQKRIPAALRRPRIEQMAAPKFDTGTQPLQDSSQVRGFDPASTHLKDALDDLQLDQRDFRNRVDDLRKDAKGQGFEAIAWFQPYHVWTEETWGIYFDARKLDDLALSFLDDFKSARVHGSHSLAALLAFGLTYAHELFHAQVEAALSWAEINAQQPRHLRYKERVYQALRETPSWLEEALANWSSWNWFKVPGIQSLVTNMVSNAEGLDRVVEASLDLAPPGYQEWRLGNQPGTWRTFANQLSTGKPKVTGTGISLPLESTLTGPFPYDLQPADIPLRFVGSGVIADRLQSHPATLNVISRRELQKALKFYRHVVDVSAGAGSHEKWTGPDNRAFPVPRTDPVSHTVFKSFLHYIGIDKTTYVRQVRPNL